MADVDPGVYNRSEFDELLPPDPGKPNGLCAEAPFAVPPTIHDGQRNHVLYRSARSLHAKGFSSAAIRAAITAENLEKCDPPLLQSEIDALATHAARQRDRYDFTQDLGDDIMRGNSPGLDPAALADVTVVAAEGQHIAAAGVPYVVDGLLPAYGMLGMLVAYAKVGKTSFALALAAAVALGRPFLDRITRQTRVLVVAAEDPPEYTAWLARHLGSLPTGVLTFYRRPLLVDQAGLAQIAATVQAGGYGLVLIASWQAVVRGLLRDENDNAGAVRVVEDVKACARHTRIPWLIDAHSGKGEDPTDDADPTKALRGASGAAAAADYLLSLRYANGPFGSRRRLSGKGRFVSCEPLVLDCDAASGNYMVIGTAKTTAAETTWRLICETGALTTTAQTADAIARTAGLVSPTGKVTTTGRRQVRDALARRDGIRTSTETRRGQVTTLYARAEAQS